MVEKRRARSRVRLKIGGEIYEMTAVLVGDRAEVARLRGGRDPIVRSIAIMVTSMSQKSGTIGEFFSEISPSILRDNCRSID